MSKLSKIIDFLIVVCDRVARVQREPRRHRLAHRVDVAGAGRAPERVRLFSRWQVWQVAELVVRRDASRRLLLGLNLHHSGVARRRGARYSNAMLFLPFLPHKGCFPAPILLPSKYTEQDGSPEPLSALWREFAGTCDQNEPNSRTTKGFALRSTA